jgi:hypothetical protein
MVIVFIKAKLFLKNGVYDSNALHKLVKELKFKKLITNKNIRNLKDKTKINKMEKFNL